MQRRKKKHYSTASLERVSWQAKKQTFHFMLSLASRIGKTTRRALLVLKLARGTVYHFYCLESFNPFYFFLFMHWLFHDAWTYHSIKFMRAPKSYLKTLGGLRLTTTEYSQTFLWSRSKCYNHLTNLFLVVIQNKVFSLAPYITSLLERASNTNIINQ